MGGWVGGVGWGGVGRGGWEGEEGGGGTSKVEMEWEWAGCGPSVARVACFCVCGGSEGVESGSMKAWHPESFLLERNRIRTKKKWCANYAERWKLATDDASIRRVQYRKCCGRLCQVHRVMGYEHLHDRIVDRFLRLHVDLQCSIQEVPLHEVAAQIRVHIVHPQELGGAWGVDRIQFRRG